MDKHDPVSALSEAEATGRTAEIFDEIREVMQIPLITSIWRALAAVDDGLEGAWSAARPIYESGQPDAVLEKLTAEVVFPMPDFPSTESLTAAGFEGDDRRSILAILDAYNRSNTLNLIALTAFVSNTSGKPSNESRTPSPVQWPILPPLLSKEEINPTDWDLLEKIKHIGASFENPAIPTLWRHLIHWPNLLTLIHEAYLPLQENGMIDQAIEHVRRFVEAEAPSISGFSSSKEKIPAEAFEMIHSYVGKPPSVSRMVTVGHSVARWLNG